MGRFWRHDNAAILLPATKTFRRFHLSVFRNIHKATMSCNLLNNGRNDIPVNNSNAKCLLENWTEEVNAISLNVDCLLRMFESRTRQGV